MADVFEDLEILFQRVIDNLSRILNGLRNRLRQNSHRPINRRTLVRWIAAFMPPPKNPRIYIQRSMNAGLDRWGSYNSLRSAFSKTSLNQFVEEDLGGDFVRYRRDTEGSDETYENVFSDNEPDFMPDSADLLNRLTSTPNFNTSSCSSLASNDPAAMARLADMEEELSSLRKQIALLVMAQEASVLNEKTVTDEEEEAVSTPKAAAVPLPESPPQLPSLNDSGCESEVPALDPALAEPSPADPAFSFPVPPPPPPPPIPVSWLQPKRKSTRATQNFSDVINQKQNLTQEFFPQAPSMVDILKDLNSVKLRAVDRSPGGTPMPRGRLDREPTDPASIIALALKKKFASHRALTPESDQENDTHSFTSDANSPLSHTLLKKARRRLSVFNDSCEVTPSSSPLKELNFCN